MTHFFLLYHITSTCVINFYSGHQKYEWSNVPIFSRDCKADTPVDPLAVMAGGGARTSAGKKQSGSICCCSSLTISDCQSGGPRRLGIPALHSKQQRTCHQQQELHFLPSNTKQISYSDCRCAPARVQDVVSVTGHLILGLLICSSATAGNMPKFPRALI